MTTSQRIVAFVPTLLACIFGEQTLHASAFTMNCTLMSGPTQATVAYATTCTASGGTTPYSWSIGSGILPKGLSLSSSAGISIKVIGTPTTPGDYLYSVKVSDKSSPAQSSSETFTGTVTAFQPPSTLTATPATLSFAPYTLGSKLPSPQSISLTSTNPSNGLAFTSVTGSDCGWLSLSLDSGNTPLGLSASVNSNVVNATAGSHSCAINFNAAGVAAPPTVTATLTVSGAPITVLPNPIAVSIVGGTQQSFPSVAQVTAADTVNITAASGSWLTADATAQPSSTFSISVDARSLTTSPPPGSLQLQCVSGTQCVAATIPVKLTVYPPLTLTCTPSTGPAQLGSAYSSTCTASGGVAPYSWTIASGTLPTGLALSTKTGASVKIAGTPTRAGAYTYTVNVTDTTPATPQSATQTFTGTLVAPQVTLMAAPAILAFGSYTSDSTGPAVQKLAITSTNPASGVAFTSSLGSDCAWLKITPTAGNTPATLSASVVTASATAGSHACTIAVNSTSISASRTATATITVAGSSATTATTLSTNPTSVSFGSAAQTVALASTNPSSGIAFTSSLGSDCAWLSPSPASGFTPTTITLLPNTANITAGSHSCVITFSSPNLSTTPLVTATLAMGSTTAPTISAVVSDASFNTAGPIASGSWVAVFGSNMAPAGDSRQWNSSTEIVNGILPTALDGTSVTVNGKHAAVEFVSPTQINIQPPDDTSIGPIQVVVSTGAGSTSAPFTVNYAQFAPGLFTTTAPYLAAQHADGTYVGGFPGATPAKPGEVITLWGTGFGPATPAVPAGQIFTGASNLANTVTVIIGGQPAAVKFAGVVEAGLVQLNVQLPSSISDGDAAVVATVGGISTQSTTNFISVHN